MTPIVAGTRLLQSGTWPRTAIYKRSPVFEIESILVYVNLPTTRPYRVLFQRFCSPTRLSSFVVRGVEILTWDSNPRENVNTTTYCAADGTLNLVFDVMRWERHGLPTTRAQIEQIAAETTTEFELLTPAFSGQEFS